MPAKTFDDKEAADHQGGRKEKSRRGTRKDERDGRGAERNVDGVDEQSVGGEQQGTICQDERFLWQLTT